MALPKLLRRYGIELFKSSINFQNIKFMIKGHELLTEPQPTIAPVKITSFKESDDASDNEKTLQSQIKAVAAQNRKILATLEAHNLSLSSDS